MVNFCLIVLQTIIYEELSWVKIENLIIYEEL